MHSSQMIECANKTLDPFDFKKLNVRHSILSSVRPFPTVPDAVAGNGAETRHRQ